MNTDSPKKDILHWIIMVLILAIIVGSILVSRKIKENRLYQIEEYEEVSSQIELNQTTKRNSPVLSASNIITKLKPSIVYLETENGFGSGFIISKDGYILTNAHVVEDFINVNISTYAEEYAGRVVGIDEDLDIALVKINPLEDLEPAKLGDSDLVKIGEDIYTLGFPFGIKGDVSLKEGIISRKLEDDFEISAEVHPGNSGGPLVNNRGEVIGINSSVYGESLEDDTLIGETIKFSIPINYVKDALDYLMSQKLIDRSAYRKSVDLFSAITSTFYQENPDVCYDAENQYKGGNYFSAYSQITECIAYHDSLVEEYKDLEPYLSQDKTRTLEDLYKKGIEVLDAKRMIFILTKEKYELWKSTEYNDYQKVNVTREIDTDRRKAIDEYQRILKEFQSKLEGN